LTEDFEFGRDTHPDRPLLDEPGEIQFETFDGRPIVFSGAVNWGRFYNGTSTEWEGQAAWKPNKYLSLSLAYQRTDIRLPAGGFAIDEIVTRMNFSLTPNLFGAVFAQWNNDETGFSSTSGSPGFPSPGLRFISSSTSSATPSTRTELAAEQNRGYAQVRLVFRPR